MSEEEKISARPEVCEVQQPPPSYIDSQQQHPMVQYSLGHQGTYAQQSSNVVVINQPNPSGGVVYPRYQQPETFMGLALCSCLCCCMPIGICAIVAASNAKSSFEAGDLEAAEKSAKNAKTLSIISIFLGVIWITTTIVIRVMYSSSSSSYY